MAWKRLTEEQKAYIIANMDRMGRAELARNIGVHPSTVRNYAKQHGGAIHRKVLTREIVARLYPDYFGAEIGRMYGVSESAVNRMARRLGVKHSAETLARRTEINRESARKAHGITDHAREGRKRHILFKMEYMRVWSGEKRKTKLRLQEHPNRVRMAKYALTHYWDYKAVDGDYMTLARGERPTPNEKRYETKYGFKFIDGNGNNEE